jgi:hypothetical protein
MWWDLRAPNSFMPEPVDFVGQQAGPVEDELKRAFLQVIAATPTVQSAYLARIYRGSMPSVAVCIRSTIGMDDKVENRLSAIFRSRFRADQRLDFLFLLEDEESRLREVCPPFYERYPS